MADAKISQLPAATSIVGTELIPVVQAGVTKRATISELVAYPGAVSAGDIGTAPNEIPLNQYLGTLAFQNAEAVVIRPQASEVPAGIGDMVFQLTNDTTLVIKVKGSDGTVRSVTLTLT